MSKKIIIGFAILMLSLYLSSYLKGDAPTGKACHVCVTQDCQDYDDCIGRPGMSCYVCNAETINTYCDRSELQYCTYKDPLEDQTCGRKYDSGICHRGVCGAWSYNGNYCDDFYVCIIPE